MATSTEILNADCHCVTVERQALSERLRRDLGGGELATRIEEVQQTLFAASPVFVSSEHIVAMRAVIDVIERVVDHPSYQQQALARAPEIARVESSATGAAGVFFGYDFHLSDQGPRLIEINTNAGGGLLSLYLARAQRACCEPVARYTTGTLDLDDLERQMVEMFRTEADLGGLGRPLRTVAIVDEKPEEQFLGPELELFRRMFELAGLRAFVVDPSELEARDGALWIRREGAVQGAPENGQRIDLLYNRLTDFYFEAPQHQHLREAYRDGRVVTTPGPRQHALYADKRNLAVLSDPGLLDSWGLGAMDRKLLERVIPRTRVVRAEDAERLWQQRKNLFFKPATGYGSRGTYDGAKLTRKTFQRIVESDYVAQERVAPSTRILILEGQPRELKVDIRCFVYRGRIQLLGARLYRGQTTNLRTEGGGLATVFAGSEVSAPRPG